MSDTVIRVENLAKKYVLGHQEEGIYSYKTFRGAMTNTAKSLAGVFKPHAKKEGKPSQEEFWALKDVSFEIQQGERVGIIGHNGAGKSTLLKILSRITEPTKGSIRIKGRVASLLEVGTGFHPELTGRENIFLNGAILGMSKVEIQRKFDEIVAFSEIEKFLDTPVKRYSSGMYVRLAFAVAAHLEPEILVVDEVLAVGDAAFQKKCLGKMGEVATEGRTVLFVSHNMGAISTLCDKAVYLEKGRVREIGKADQVVTSYLSDQLLNKVEDLERLRLRGFGEKVRFSDIRLISQDGSNILFGKPIKYAFTIQSNSELHDLSIGSSIFSSLGNCVGNLLSEKTFSISINQELTFELTLANFNLAPGSYYAGFSIGQGGLEATSRHDFDIVIGQPIFQIMPISDENSHIANWSSNWGYIVFREAQLVLTDDCRRICNDELKI